MFSSRFHKDVHVVFSILLARGGYARVCLSNQVYHVRDVPRFLMGRMVLLLQFASYEPKQAMGEP